MLLAVVSAGNALATTYNIVELPLPPSTTGGAALDINATGDVVGYVIASHKGLHHATVWVAPDLSPHALLENTVDYKASEATGINDRGHILGEMRPRRAGVQTAHVVWQPDGSFVSLKEWPGQQWSHAYDINARNTVVGSFMPGEGSGGAAIWFTPKQIRWLGATDPGFSEGEAYAINDSGMVVGFGRATGGSVTHAFRWTPGGGMQDLGDLPGGLDGSQAYDVNEAGQIVGNGWSESGGRAVLWNANGSMLDLGVLPGDDGHLFYDAFDINNLGEVIGWTSGSAVIHFLWTAGSGMVRIIDVIDPSDPWYQRLQSGDSKISVYDLNDAGVIVGALYKGGATTVPVMLVPQSCTGVPEPQVSSHHRGASAAMQGTGCL